MKWYYGISLVVSLLALSAWLVSIVTYVPKRAGDGNGPDVIGILIFFSIWAVGFFLLHSGVLAFVMRNRATSSIFHGRAGFAIHAVLGLLFGVPVLLSVL